MALILVVMLIGVDVMLIGKARIPRTNDQARLTNERGSASDVYGGWLE